MKMLFFVILLFPPLVSMCLGNEYYSPEFGEDMPETEAIPAEGGICQIPFTYVNTRFQPGREYRQFRYRLLLGDEPGPEQYPGQEDISYTEDYDAMYDMILSVDVPANDSGFERTVKVEVSVDKQYSGDPFTSGDEEHEWGDWFQVYSGIQSGTM